MSKLSAFLLEHSRIISFFSIVGSAALFAIAASLSIVLLVSGSDDGVLEHCNIVTLNTSRVAQNMFDNSTLFFLNDTNPVFRFVTRIRVANSTNVTEVVPSMLGAFGVEPGGPILEPALQPLLNSTVVELFNQLGPILTLAPGSPAPEIFTNATDNALRAADDGLASFLDTVTNAMIQNTWQEFASFLQGGGGAAAAAARVAAREGSMTTSTPIATPTPSTTAAAKLRDRELEAVPSLQERQLPEIPDPLSIGPMLSSFGSVIVPGASASSTASGSGGAASPTSTGSPDGGLLGGLLPDEIPDEVVDAFGPVFYNVLSLAVASIVNTGLEQIMRVFNANNTDPAAQFLQNVTAEFAVQIRDMFNADVGSLANSSRTALGVPDFYSAHLGKYCYGSYTPAQPVDPGQSTENVTDWNKEVSGCAHISSWRDYDISQPLMKRINETGDDVYLPPIYLPDVLRNNLNLLEMLTEAIYALQILGVVVCFLSILTFVVTVLWRGREGLVTNIIEFSSLLAALGAPIPLLIVAVLVTTTVLVAEATVKQVGSVVSVTMESGSLWQGLAWTASVLSCIAASQWGLYIYIRRLRRSEVVEVYDDKDREMEGNVQTPMLPEHGVERTPARSFSLGSDSRRVSSLSKSQGLESSGGADERPLSSFYGQTDSPIGVARPDHDRGSQISDDSDPPRSELRGFRARRPPNLHIFPPATRGPGGINGSIASMGGTQVQSPTTWFGRP